MSKGQRNLLTGLLLIIIAFLVLSSGLFHSSSDDKASDTLSARTQGIRIHSLEEGESLWSVAELYISKADHTHSDTYRGIIVDTVRVIVRSSQENGLLPEGFDPWGEERLLLKIGQRLTVPDDLSESIWALRHKGQMVLVPKNPKPESTDYVEGPNDCPTSQMDNLSLNLFEATNSERSTAGLPKLLANHCIVYVAQIRSNDMANLQYFSHSSPSGHTAFSLLSSYGVAYGWAGENLARNNYPNSQTAAVAIRDLMASPSHRDNILNSHYTQIGVATAKYNGMKYFTMIFVGPS